MRETISRLLSKGDTVALLEIIHGSLSITDGEGFRQTVGRLKGITPYGCATCVLGRRGDEGIKEPYEVINADYPREWIDIYAERKYHLVDPVMKENFRRFGLQYWADTYRLDPPPPGFLYHAEDFDLRDGYTYGMTNFRETHGSLFSISGESVERHGRTELVLTLVVPHLHQAIMRIAEGKKKTSENPLSVREREVLQWIGQGKSTWDISLILSISEATVKFHVKNIMQKLDSVSRPQAVAVALEQGLIEVG